MPQDVSSRRGVTRRGFLTVAVSAVVAGVVAGVGAYYAGRLAAPAEVTKEVTRTVERTTTITAPPTTVTKTITTTVTTTVAATTPTPTKENEVRIGNLASMTGQMAAFGQPAAFAIRKCVEDVNRLGGLDVGGKKLPVKLIQYDDSSDPSKATALAEQLILQDKVQIIIVPPGPPVVSIPVNQVAERYKIPCLSDGYVESWWGAGPWKYCWTGNLPWFVTPVPGNDFRAGKPGYRALYNFLDFTDLFRDRLNKKIALFATNDADGKTFFELAPKVAEAAGYTIVGVEKSLGLYAPGTVDFTAIIREWMKGEADVLWGMSIGADFATMWRQAASLGWKPKMAMDGRALKNYDDVAAIGGDLAIGLTDPFQAWHPSLTYKSFYGGRTCASLADEWTRETGKAWTEMLVTYGWAETACRAIEIAGSLDPEKINQAFPNIDFMSIAGRVKIIPEYHSSPSLFHVAQWVKTNKPWVWEAEIVWCADPSIKPTHDIVFPLP